MIDAQDWVVGGVIAFAVTLVTTPAGVSGAVLLLPVQISVLHVRNPALTPTNLLYNVLAKGTGTIAPEWLLGLSMRLGAICLALAVRYALQGAGVG